MPNSSTLHWQLVKFILSTSPFSPKAIQQHSALLCHIRFDIPYLSVLWAACLSLFLPQVSAGRSGLPHSASGNLTATAEPARPESNSTRQLPFTHVRLSVRFLKMYLSPLHLHHSLHLLNPLEKLTVRFHGFVGTGRLLPHLLLHLDSRQVFYCGSFSVGQC